MQRTKSRLKGSTMVETLVMMLVAGIIFLTVMDGLMLFSRLQSRRTKALLTGAGQREGYFRLQALVHGADSIEPAGYRRLELYRSHMPAVLSLRDSAIVCSFEESRDTLLTGFSDLRLVEYDDRADTVELVANTGLVLRIPVRKPVRERYRNMLEEIEEGYGYEN